MTRVLITGASGFIGRILCRVLADAGHSVRAAVRSAAVLPGASDSTVTGEINERTDWRGALAGIDAVVHLAARVHRLDDSADDAELYAQTNALGTRHLVQQAASSGVSRFVFLSTVKVNGESTGSRPFRADDIPAPQDEYGRSKLAAEYSVHESAASGVMPVIVRAPLTYGPGVRANFLRLLEWVDRERPLPFAAIHNRRSLISVWNLCDLLRCTLEHPRAAGTWLASDGEDLSTPDLIRGVARALQRRARLLPIPASVLILAGRMCGREAQLRRLCESLTIDASPARDLLGWSAPLSVESGLARTAAWYRTERAA